MLLKRKQFEVKSEQSRKAQKLYVVLSKHSDWGYLKKNHGQGQCKNVCIVLRRNFEALSKNQLSNLIDPLENIVKIDKTRKAD